MRFEGGGGGEIILGGRLFLGGSLLSAFYGRVVTRKP